MDLMKTAPLQELADALHLEETLHEYEGRDALSVTSEILTSRFPDRGAFEALLRNLRDAYGANVTFELSADVLLLFALDDDPDGLYRAIPTHTTLTFFLKVDKRLLLQQRGYAAESCAFLLFLFPEALHRALDVPLMELESELLADFETAAKIIILVAEREIELRGPHLEIIGGNAQSSTVVSPPPADIVRAARDLLKWVHYELTVLTPMHLEITLANAKKGDAIAEVAFAQWMLCSLLYLANHSRFDPDQKQWIATFVAERNSVPVDVDAAALLPGTDAARAIGRRTRWVYEGDKQVADRLTIAQNVIAHVLEDAETSMRAPELVRQAEEIAKRIEGGWKAFIGQKLDKYFGQIKQLEDTVDATSRAYDEQVQALTKALIDSMLAAVGVVIGSFIAAMFKSPFQKYVFWFGTGVYLVYLVAFPIGVGLSVTWIRFRAARAAFATRRKAFEERLTPAGVDEIVGKTVERRGDRVRMVVRADDLPLHRRHQRAAVCDRERPGAHPSVERGFPHDAHSVRHAREGRDADPRLRNEFRQGQADLRNRRQFRRRKHHANADGLRHRSGRLLGSRGRAEGRARRDGDAGHDDAAENATVTLRLGNRREPRRHVACFSRNIVTAALLARPSATPITRS